MLSGWFFDYDTGGRARMFIRWYDASGAQIPVTPVYSDYTVDLASWQFISVLEESPANASFADAVIRVYDTDEQQVILSVDAVSFLEPYDPVLTPTPTPTAPPTVTPTTAPCDTNIIPNGNFSSWSLGALNNWNPESGIVTGQNTLMLRPGTSDGVALQLSRTGIGTDIVSEYAGVNGGNVYDAGIWVRDNDPDVNIRFMVFFYNSSLTYIGSTAWLETAGAVSSYQELFIGSVVLPANAAWARAVIRFIDEDGTWPGSNYGVVTVDDCAVIEPCGQITPTPTVTPTAAISATIYQIQYTTSGSGSSPFAGTVVRTQGIVTAVEEGNPNVFIQDQTAPWCGLHINFPTGNTGFLSRGDDIIVQGLVTEIFGMTSINDPGYVEILSSGNPLPAFITVTPDDVSQEAYECVLLRVQNVTVSNPASGPGEWEVSALGQTATVDDMFTYSYVPTLNEDLDWVRGPVSSELGNFKLQPRDDNDISATYVALPALGVEGSCC